MAKQKQKWSELAPRQKATIVAVGSVQLSLAATAWADLARRRADEVNGSKAKWAALIAINWVGPILYFTKGRRRAT